MVSIQHVTQYVNGVACDSVICWGDSTDDKPTEGIGNGSTFIEMDTSKLYFFSAGAGVWREWGGGS